MAPASFMAARANGGGGQTVTEEDPWLLGDYGNGNQQGAGGHEQRPLLGPADRASFDDEPPPLLNDYLENEVRLGFVRKVYGILTAQLLLTALLVAPFHLNSAVKRFADRNPWLIWLASALALCFICFLSCVPEAARKTPNNYIMLFTFTAIEAVVIGAVSAEHDADSVLLSVGVTAVIFLVLTLYACKTDADFTGYGIYLVTCLSVLLFLGLAVLIFGSIFGGMSSVFFIWNLAILMVFCCYIVYDTQLILGGKHRQHEFTIDDYVLAAITLFIAETSMMKPKMELDES